VARIARVVLASIVVVCSGCAPDEVAETESEATEGFNKNLVMLDGALTDADALDASAIQALLEATPWGTRSVLADYASNGRSAAEAIAEAAQAHGINPLAILVRAQLEQSLLARESAPAHRLDHAMGCGCPDGGGCSEAFRGFDRQVACMAELLRSFLDELDADGATVSGWAVGSSKMTRDGYHVRPANAATAALYTYTPWVESNKDHLSLWRTIASFVGYVAPGPGGCGVAEFPSGVRLQLVPNEELAAEYEHEAPACFLDADSLIDPESFTSYDTSVRIAPNFVLHEFVQEASSRTMLLDPGLVDALQRIRTELGSGIAIEVAYQSPKAHDTACAGVCEGDVCASAPSCEPPHELARGTAALVDATVSPSSLLQAAAASGVPSCWQEGEHVFIGVGSNLGCPR
jgi:hypothetical protein